MFHGLATRSVTWLY